MPPAGQRTETLWLASLLDDYARTNRLRVLGVEALLIACIALVDWKIRPNAALGFLYLFPILVMAPLLRRWQILLLSVVCTFLREAFMPLAWTEGWPGRLVAVLTVFSGAGLLFAELARQRQLAVEHLSKLQLEVQRRREAEDQLRVLVESSPAAILTLDGEGTILLANDAAQRLLGYDAEPLAGRSIEGHLPVLASVLGQDGAAPFFRTTMECTGRRRDGDVFLAQVCFSTYQTGSGPRLAAIVWDASDNLRDREGVGLDTLLTASRILVGAIAHEVRNVSAAAALAHSNLGRLSGVADNEDFKALGALVQGLEEIASAELRPPADRNVATANLYQLLDELRIVIEPLFDGSETLVRWEVDAGLPRVRGDRHSLLRVFLNLAQNSQRSMQGTRPRRLTVSVALEAPSIVVRIRDTGKGIATPERLFRPFQTGAETSGLGLYLSRAMMRSFGGDLRYEKESQGSCFVVELAAAHEAAG